MLRRLSSDRRDIRGRSVYRCPKNAVRTEQVNRIVKRHATRSVRAQPPQRVGREVAHLSAHPETDRLADLVVVAAGDVAATVEVVIDAESVPRHQRVVALDETMQRDAPESAAQVVGVL